MLVGTGHQAQSNSPTDSLSHSSLVHGSKACFASRSYPAGLGDEVCHYGKVLWRFSTGLETLAIGDWYLVESQRVYRKNVKHILSRTIPF